MQQHTAVELTELASDMQALAFKHANEVSQVLVSVRPILASIPIVSRIVEGEAFSKAAELSSTIVATTQKTRKVIEDLRKALIESNPVYLQTVPCGHTAISADDRESAIHNSFLNHDNV